MLPARDDLVSSDLLSFFVPSVLLRAEGLRFSATSASFVAGFVEDGAYLGLPLILMVALAVRAGWRRLEVRVAAIAGLVAAVLSLGGYLHVRGPTGVPLPWWPATHLPVLGLMLPARFVIYVFLAAGMLGAWWLSRARRLWLAWPLAALAVVALWPATGRNYWSGTPPLPPLFTQARYAHVFSSRDTVLVPPVGGGGDSMLWQAVARMRFRMASGYVVPPEAPDPYKSDPLYPTLTGGVRVPDQQAAAGSFITLNNITAAAVDAALPTAAPWIGILERLGWRAQTIGGVVVLRPAGAKP